LKRKGDAESYFGLALAQRRLGALDRAIDNLEKAGSLMPRDGEIFRELGAMYFLKADMAQARKNLETARSLSPADALTYFYLGRIYSELGLAYGAKGMLGEAYRCFGAHYRSVGDNRTALTHFEKALPFYAEPSLERQAIQKEIEELTPKKQEIRGPRERNRGALGR
jgi:tetratricopeptide (TPR) repeat protein